MSIRFPDFGVLFHRSADRTGPAHRAANVPDARALACTSGQDQGGERETAHHHRARERVRPGDAQTSARAGAFWWSATRLEGKGRHVDLEA